MRAVSRATVTLGGTAGERLTMALVLLTLCVEVLSDNACRPPQGEVMTHDQCARVCYPHGIAEIGPWMCKCAVPAVSP